MKKAWIAYGTWLTAVLVMAAIALAWYRYVEQVTWRALAARLNEPPETP